MGNEILKQASNGGGNVVKGFLLGAVMLAVAVVGFFVRDNYTRAAAPI
jgi:hypothetical protein